MHATKPNRQAAFTWIEMSVVIVCLVLLVGFSLLPRLAKGTGGKAGRFNCYNNLKNIGLAYRIVASDNGDCLPWQLPTTNRPGVLPIGYAAFPGTPLLPAQGIAANFASMSNELLMPKIIVCPYDAKRIQLKTNSWAHLMAPAQVAVRDRAVSYFIGTSARQELPRSVLSGDRNFAGRPFSADMNTPPSQVALRIPHSVATNSTGLKSAVWTKSIHQHAGNLLLGDGSVQQVPSGRTRDQFREAALESGTDLDFIWPAN